MTESKETKIEVQIPFFNVLWNRKTKSGINNLNYVFQSCVKTKNENRSSNSVFIVVAKRKTKLEVRVPSPHVVGKRLALRNTHSVCLSVCYRQCHRPPPLSFFARALSIPLFYRILRCRVHGKENGWVNSLASTVTTFVAFYPNTQTPAIGWINKVWNNNMKRITTNF